ncbi:MAG: 2,3-bisphosphoglycerate-independent phosphoglycerate mutase [Clostridia bacterium]|nr:2,3-bisphosphoglycerate-independent phosphoglycerate mutase [Clostridia bacterium]
MTQKKTIALIILDGFGMSEKTEGNAIAGNAPFFDFLTKQYPFCTLSASGADVGLPRGQMGNSEVGHLNIGAGRVVFQDLPRINNSIYDGSFFENAELVAACEKAKTTGCKLHIMGLVSDGGVHSHMTHIFALLELAKRRGVPEVFVHCYMDGRDTPPDSGLGFVRQLNRKIKEIGIGKIATVCGRFYAMDRDNRWDRIEKAYDMLALSKGERASDAEQALRECYDKGILDEFVPPTVITENDKPVAAVEDGDVVIFFNFRSDRPRELTRAFTEDGFNAFSLKGKARKVTWVTMTRYDEAFKNVRVAFSPQEPAQTLGQVLAEKGKKQLRIAETEKYAHVTFFFNGGVEEPNDGEKRVLIDSPKVATYDLQPEMSAYFVCDRALNELEKNDYDVMILNFANCDMVGHTGNFEAARQAVKVVDECLRRLTEYILARGGVLLVTADHGNAEMMTDAEGKPHTAHTTNRVPFVLAGVAYKNRRLRRDGSLCDIAPTLLEIAGIEKPEQMSGRSLLEK